MINKSQLIQEISIYSLPLLYLASLISLGNGALFDLVFIPFYLFLILFGFFQEKLITSSIKKLSYCYIFSIFFIIIIKNIFLVKETQLFVYLIYQLLI